MSSFVMRSALLVFAISLSGTAGATVVTGQVTSSGGSGISNVDLDFIDRDTGNSIPLVNDNTDVLGFYAVSIPPGDYDVRFKPATGQRFVAVEIRGEKVEGGSMVLNQQLDDGWFLSGRVVTELMAPISALDLDVNDLIGGGPIYVTHDNTDVAGMFQLVLPVGSFSVEFEPPLGSALVPRLVDDISITGDLALGDVTLVSGFHLSGEVLNPIAAPVASTKVETLDPVTGVEIFNIRNTTGLTGLFDLVVAPEPYSLYFTPPRGTPLLPRLLGGINVQSDLALPPLMLDGGALVTGLVTGSGAGFVESVDLDFTSSLSGIERVTPTDNTDQDGQYAVAVMPGTYDIDFTPPPGSGLAPKELLDVVIASSTSLPTVQLQPAQIVSGTVRDTGGSALPGVDLDFIDPVSGAEIASSGDFTTIGGGFSASIASGTYDIEFNPQDGSGVAQHTLLGVFVGGDLNLGVITLTSASAPGVATISPTTGSAAGGTTVTVTGIDFAPGVKVRVGGQLLTGVTLLNSTSLQGTTRAHPVGTVDITVTNPGATTDALLLSAFSYVPPASDSVLTLSKSGPLGTDITLQWTDTLQSTYSLFRSEVAAPFGPNSLLEVQTSTSYRDDAAAAPGVPRLLFYRVQ